MGFASQAGNPRPSIRVLVAEDEEPLRAAIAELLSIEDGFEVVAAVADADAAIEQARLTLPDVALLDVRMPGGGGQRAAREIALVSPRTKSIALSAYDDHSNVLGMLRAGAIGYLVKGAPAGEILDAIARATQGQSSLPSDVVAEVFGELGVESGRRLGLLIEHAPDGVIVVDRAGRIVLVNEQVEQLFGYARGDLVGERVEMLLPGRFRDRHAVQRETYTADPHTRTMGVGLELVGRRADGSEFPVDVSLSGVETPEGRLVAAFVRDETDRRKHADRDRELAARHAVLARVVSAGEDERRQIASDIHDDSIQVMTAAGMRLQILRRSLDSPDQLERLDELERTIRLSISRLRHLIFELRPPALDLEGLGAALRLCVEEAAAESGVVYEIEDLLVVEPVEERRLVLYRIVQEVLSNIRKHASARTVKVTISEREGGYHLRIVDDGVGFDTAIIDRRSGHLGLAAVRERAELADGWLRVESAPGAGTTVECWIASGVTEAERGVVRSEATAARGLDGGGGA